MLYIIQPDSRRHRKKVCSARSASVSSPAGSRPASTSCASVSSEGKLRYHIVPCPCTCQLVKVIR